MSFNWTEQAIDRARREWLAGASASQIARILGTTRNAVIEKITRLGLARKYSSAPKRSMPRRPTCRPVHVPRDRMVAIIKVTKPIPIARPVSTGGCSIHELQPGDCRFPLWTDHRVPIADKRFCGQPALSGRSYCSGCLPRLVTTMREAA